MPLEQKRTCSPRREDHAIPGNSACAVGEGRATVGMTDKAAACENWLCNAHPSGP